MNLFKKFKTELRREWYVQGLSAVPLYLNCAAWSGMAMRKLLGFGYTRLLHVYHNGYGEMWYWLSDFPRIWEIIRRKLAKDPRYLEKWRRQYDVTFRQYERFFKAITPHALRTMDEGGITCHAAIVSRELGIPCVIGTRVATHILKDGMLVEVKGNHGVVKIFS